MNLGLCTSGFISPIKCNKSGQCPPGLFCDSSVSLCCPLLLALPDALPELKSKKLQIANLRSTQHQQPRQKNQFRKNKFTTHSFSNQNFNSFEGFNNGRNNGGHFFGNSFLPQNQIPTVKKRRS